MRSRLSKDNSVLRCRPESAVGRHRHAAHTDRAGERPSGVVAGYVQPDTDYTGVPSKRWFCGWWGGYTEATEDTETEN